MAKRVWLPIGPDEFVGEEGGRRHWFVSGDVWEEDVIDPANLDPAMVERAAKALYEGEKPNPFVGRYPPWGISMYEELYKERATRALVAALTVEGDGG